MVCKTVDALASIRDPKPYCHHIYLILKGIPFDYAPIVFVIESQFGVMDLDEVEVLFLAHEICLRSSRDNLLVCDGQTNRGGCRSKGRLFPSSNV